MIPLTRIAVGQRTGLNIRETVYVRADKVVYVRPGPTSGATVYVETAAGWIFDVAETEDQVLQLLKETT